MIASEKGLVVLNTFIPGFILHSHHLAPYPHGRYKDYLFDMMKSLLALKMKRLILDEDMDYLLMEAAEQNYWPVSEKEITVSIKMFTVRPAEAERGSMVKLLVVPEGKVEDIFMLKGYIREAPHLQYLFHDDGKNGDEKQNDNVWTSLLEVFSDATPGTYHVDIQAIDTDWNPIYRTATVKDGFGERASVAVTVK